ncbi:general transcription factor 3C polypeptide 2 [Aulostomus maculatus]
MDAPDSGPGQETPSKPTWDLAPSLKGRHRRKNPKYFDYETNEANDESADQKKQERTSRRGGAAASQTTPRKRGKKAEGEEQEPVDSEPRESDEEIPEKKKSPLRAKRTSSKKTRAKRAPARKTPAAAGSLPAGEGGAGDGVQQENGTPKPKRKYVRKQVVKEVEPELNSACEKNPEEPLVEPEEEATPGGRRRRGAAKAALKYLHALAEEELCHRGHEPRAGSDVTGAESQPDDEQNAAKGSKGRRGRKRKRHDSDPAEDEDFVPNIEEEEAEEMEEEEMEEEEEAEEDREEDTDSDTDADLWSGGRNPAAYYAYTNTAGSKARDANGLHVSTMRTVWDSIETNKKFREEHHSSWVFPDWVPSTSTWHPVPQSDVEEYLPQELQSAAFRVSREGLSNQETTLQRLQRFDVVPAHPDRWDMVLFAGGPVWTTEWCPTPDGAPATQYLALACHRGMDDQHYVHKTYGGPGLVQLWDLGKLEYNSSPDSQPRLAYGLAQDKGFVWHLRWCPAGGWELPSCSRKAPFLPRLGLLAVATSTGVVTIYSLPHPDALHASHRRPGSGEAGWSPGVYKAEGVLTLKLGSLKSPRHEQSGQVLSMDWLPEKPHNVIAVGFYDGVVGLWDLSTKSALLRVRESHESPESLSLLPYRCFLAHGHAVRALAFCPANRYLLVTAGEDRYMKTWDLRRLYEPITVHKRNLTNEICWPLNAPGLMWAQESTYAANSSHGIHFTDHYMRTYFAGPRTSTMWSLSYSDWLNCLVTSDVLGEVILFLLPQICFGPQYIKRTIERRFQLTVSNQVTSLCFQPIYFTSLVPYEEPDGETEGVEEERGDAVGEREGAGAASEGGNEENWERGGDRGGGGTGGDHLLPFQTYKEAVKRYYLQHEDNDWRTLANSEKRPMWKRMKSTEAKTKINLDEMPLAALHTVRFSPNMSCHMWVASGGHTGLVRLNCLRSMNSAHVKTMISENQAQFSALYAPADQEEAESDQR